MFDKIKAYWQLILEVLVGILTLAFLFEKRKNDTNEALVAEQDTKDQVQTLQKQVNVNDGQLQAEEQKREELKKENADAKSDDADASTFLGKR